MKRLLPILLLGLPLPAAANDYPTIDRVEYVVDCLQAYGGQHEYLYKCSCAIDYIAGKLPHEEYIQISTGARGLSMAGERGAEFRDPGFVRKGANKFKALQTEANDYCLIKQPSARK